jgi:hypothetical protein
MNRDMIGLQLQTALKYFDSSHVFTLLNQNLPRQYPIFDATVSSG